MGNCTNCVQQQQSQQTTNLTSASSLDNSSRSLRRNLLSNRFRTTRTFQPYTLNALIDETLSVIRTVVDTDQEAPRAMVAVSRIANREDQWLDVMIALIERIPIHDPLGATVIALLLDECSLPSKELLQQLIKRVCLDNRSRMALLESIIDDYIQVNNQQLQNSTSETYVNRDEKNHLNETTPIVNEQEREKTNKIPSFSNIYSSKCPASATKTVNTSNTQNQNKLDSSLHRERNTLVLLGCLAEKLVGPMSASMLNTIALEFIIDRVYLEYYEPWSKFNNCLKRQIGFYAQWLLDNVFILDYRRPSYEVIDHRYINVMLNDKDVSEYLKIGPDGLEARSDTVSFESVRCTFHVNTGVWYYEVLIITDGVMQIGWATKQSKFMNHEGYGIGDDQYSIAYDGCRNLIWFGAKSIPHSNPAWKSGDIVGCLIDFNQREVIFSLNGHSLDPSRKLFTSLSNPIVDGYFAAASFMSYQHCRFNFGSMPFRYPPTNVSSYKTFNEYGQLSEDEKLILPKYKKLELLRSIKISEQDCILCVDDLANVMLKPCRHTGFCGQCALKLDLCPICRSEIQERFIITE
ncbi:unnamed protein product [Rotaria socialis]